LVAIVVGPIVWPKRRVYDFFDRTTELSIEKEKVTMAFDSHSLPPRLSTLLTAACHAPSEDNTQPWHFTVDPVAGLIGLAVNPLRDPSPMNANQRMSRIALGAALENVLRTARINGWFVEVLDNQEPDLAVVRVADPTGPAGAVDPILLSRTTNRLVYEQRAVPSTSLAKLRHATDGSCGVRTLWITERERIVRLAEFIGECDGFAFSLKLIREAFLPCVQSDRNAIEGIPRAALELGLAAPLNLALLSFAPQWLLRSLGAFRTIGAHSRRLVAGASGLCLVIAPDNHPKTDVQVGRVVQKAWLALTTEGLAAQPMMTFPVLESAVVGGTIPANCEPMVTEGYGVLRRAVSDLGQGRVAFMLRFGYAAAPSARAGRLGWQQQTSIAPLFTTEQETGLVARPKYA
jgi:hypothetical protein